MYVFLPGIVSDSLSLRCIKDVTAVSPHRVLNLQDASSSAIPPRNYRGTDDRSRHRDRESHWS